MDEAHRARRVRPPPESRREQILAEATQLIGERGYYGFGIRELASRCGISNPAVLHHFGTKEQLLIALLERRDQLVSQILRASLAAAGAGSLMSPAADLNAVTLEHIKMLFHETAVQATLRPELLRLFTVLKTEALNADHPANEFFKKRHANVVSGYAQLIRAAVTNACSKALHLVVSLEGLQEEWLRADQAFDLVAETDAAVSRILADC